MSVIPITFFVVLNFLILALLTKATILKKPIVVGLIVVLILLFGVKFFNLVDDPLSMGGFYHLLSFSLGLIILHYGSEIMMSIFRKKLEALENKSFAEKYLIPFFNFLRLRLIYVLLLAYQIIFIISMQEF